MTDFLTDISSRLAEIQAEGLWKTEREITSAQGGHITVGGRDMINLCANNYLVPRPCEPPQAYRRR